MFSGVEWGKMRKITTFIYIILLSFPFFLTPAKAYADSATPTPVSHELGVTANVPAHTSDFQFDLTSSATADKVGSDATITYTITYGSLLSYSSSFTLEAQWSMGTIRAKNLYAFDIVSYVSGSAARAYNESLPTIDLAKKKISWKIENFPQNTKDRTVSFKLKTPARYVTNQNIDFTVKAKLYASDISLPEKEVKLTYTPTQFIQKALSEFEIIAFDIRELRNTSASLMISTSQPSAATVYYGTDLDLGKSITDATLSQQKVVTLNNLAPNTTYYLKVKVENAQGVPRTTPEIFTFTTPSSSFFAAIDQENTLIGAFGTILKNRASMGKGAAVLSTPQKSLDIFLPFITSPPSLVFLKLVNSQVLGINNIDPPPFLEKIRLLETEPGVFSGKITTPAIYGNYDLLVETQNMEGSYTLDLLTKMIIREPIKILSSSGVGIEHARITLELYNPRSGIFEYFPAETFGFKNPTYSESDGSVDMPLPPGRYKIRVAARGFVPKEEIFDFSPLKNESFPKIILAKSSFSLKDTLLYYGDTLGDTIGFFNFNLDQLISSYRFINLSFILGLLTLSILSLFLTAHHLKIKLEDLLVYLAKHWRKLSGYRIPSENLFTGFIENKTGMPIHGAAILLISPSNKNIIYKNITNVFGEFHLPVEKGREYDLMITKKGFEALKKRIGAEELEKNRHLFQLEEEATLPRPKIVEFFLVGGRALLRMFSDTLFFAVIIFHLFYIAKFGIVRILPITLITLFNLSLWLELVWRDFQQKSRAPFPIRDR